MVALADLDVAAQTQVADLHAALELAGADPEEGDPVTVGRVHVGLDLKDEAGERLFVGRNHPGDRGPLAGMGGIFHKGVQQLLHTKGVDGAAEKDRGLTARQVVLQVKGVGGTLQQLHIVCAVRRPGCPAARPAGDRPAP